MTLELLVSIFLGLSFLFFIVGLILLISTIGLREAIRQELADWALELFNQKQMASSNESIIEEMNANQKDFQDHLKDVDNRYIDTVQQVQKVVDQLREDVHQTFGPQNKFEQ